MEKTYCLYLEKRIEYFRVEESCLTSQQQKYNDEVCTGRSMYNNKYIWQNNVQWLRLVNLGRKQFPFVWELLFLLWSKAGI